MDTPITISSTTNSIERSAPRNRRRESDKSIARVPISWSSPSKSFDRSETNCTPSAYQKVNSWINSLSRIHVRSDSKQNSDLSEFDMHENGLEEENDMFIKCEIEKSVSKGEEMIEDGASKQHSLKFGYEDNSEQKTSPLKDDCGTVSPKNVEGLYNGGGPKKHSYPKATKRRKSTENLNMIEKEVEKSEDYESDVPLSPESEKKKELCSYLQLMKPTDKKTVMILQNRRSVRVKNLSLLQEKRELEKKLREENSEYQNGDLIPTETDTGHFPGLKSFKELNVDLDKKKYKWLKYNGTKESSDKAQFKMPKPPDSFAETIKDFDNVKSIWFTKRKLEVDRKKKDNVESAIEQDFCIPKPLDMFVSRVKSFDEFIEKNTVLTKKNILTENTDNAMGGRTEEAQSEEMKVPKRRGRRRKSDLMQMQLNQQKINAKSPGKVGKRSTRYKPRLISDIIRSLRNRNIGPTPPKIKRKKNKAHALKQVQNGGKVKERRRVQKTVSKDTNENPIVSTSATPTLYPEKDDLILSTDVDSMCKDTFMMSTILSSKGDTFMRKRTSSSHMPDFLSDVEFCHLSSKHQKSLQAETGSVFNFKLELPIVAIYNKRNDINCENILRNREDFNGKKVKSQFYCQNINIEKEGYDEQALLSENEEEFSPILKSIMAPDPTQDIHMNKNDQVDEKYSNERVLATSSEETSDPFSPNDLPAIKTPPKCTPFKKLTDTKSLHRSLNTPKRKSLYNNLEAPISPHSWPLDSPSQKQKKSQHSINISKENGNILKAFYVEYNLILCQEFMVSFWTQTALGNVLGAQNMWIHKGSVQRLAMNNMCIFKESLEMVVSSDNNVAYIELWTKEHQSDFREGPVADVFATVYFWRKGFNGLEKKVLQLENINGFADDVQYSVLKYTQKIIVSWHLASNELESKKTFVHCYQLAPDYQTVFNISEFETVEHYVSSLHNIEDCDSLIMGCGENKVTLWNVEYGYVVATIEMSEIKSPLCTLWVRCDRGFLFTLQQCVDRELRLIAINGMNHSWKKLASYVPPEEYDRLKGVCVENGIILAFYDQGILAWNAQTAEAIVEESQNEAEYISVFWKL